MCSMLQQAMNYDKIFNPLYMNNAQHLHESIQNSAPCLAQTCDNKINLIYKLYSICFIYTLGRGKQETRDSKERNV